MSSKRNRSNSQKAIASPTSDALKPRTEKLSKSSFETTSVSKWREPAVLVATLALVLSVFQLALTSPLIVERFRTPKLVLKNERHYFPRLANTGNVAATNIRIGMVTHRTDQITFTRDLGASTKAVTTGEIAQHTIVIPSLAPGEELTIGVMRGEDSKDHFDVYHTEMKEIRRSELPAVQYIRSNEGIGVSHLPTWDFRSLRLGETSTVRPAP
jgi:hypothetical protein